jgi:hypothetical protein
MDAHGPPAHDDQDRRVADGDVSPKSLGIYERRSDMKMLREVVPVAFLLLLQQGSTLAEWMRTALRPVMIDTGAGPMMMYPQKTMAYRKGDPT